MLLSDISLILSLKVHFVLTLSTCKSPGLKEAGVEG